MPPRQLLTKEEIIKAALEIAKSDGLNAITARGLGSALGCSARPIFTVFENMEEVKNETVKAAKELYKSYVYEGMQQKISFRGVGLQYVKFANDEPKLFQMLFMKENKELPSLKEALFNVDENSDEILKVLEKQYRLDRENAKKYYLHMWIYAHGIATLTATRVCKYEDEELAQILGEVARGMLNDMSHTNGDKKDILEELKKSIDMEEIQ